MTSPISRRRFLEHAALVAVGPAVLRHAAPPVLRIGVVGAANERGARQSGVLLGIDEARRAAAMFGGSVSLAWLSGEQLGRIDTQLAAVIGDGDPSRCRRLSSETERAGVLFMNVACTDDALRGADCRRMMFHVAPSDAMLRDAATQGGAGAVTAWDPRLERFGADTLNRRFRARFARDMTAEAWAAWMAVKILWESSLRARTTTGRGLREYLERDTTRFDGHKGRTLSFRAWDHQLRQPLYVVRDGSVIEVPVAPGDADASNDLLDTLGASRGESACRWS